MTQQQREVDQMIQVQRHMIAALQQTPGDEILWAQFNEYALNLWVYAERHGISTMSAECHEAQLRRWIKEAK